MNTNYARIEIHSSLLCLFRFLHVNLRFHCPLLWIWNARSPCDPPAHPRVNAATPPHESGLRSGCFPPSDLSKNSAAPFVPSLLSRPSWKVWCISLLLRFRPQTIALALWCMQASDLSPPLTCSWNVSEFAVRNSQNSGTHKGEAVLFCQSRYWVIDVVPSFIIVNLLASDINIY